MGRTPLAVRAWRHPAALAPEGERSPRAWLFTVARHLAIDRLAPHHRDVIVALFYQGNSIAEAAALLDVPEGSIKSRCHYALRSLRVPCDEAWLSTVYP
jgi:RNA polymerase sigma-70 factor (ECF subfamily)